MAEAIKVLGQTNPAVTTLTDAYTVPALTSAVLSSIHICNRTGSSVAVRVSVAVAGAADDLKQYLLYDVEIDKNDPLVLTEGITLGTGDVVRVYTDTLGVSFSLFGTEVS